MHLRHKIRARETARNRTGSDDGGLLAVASEGEFVTSYVWETLSKITITNVEVLNLQNVDEFSNAMG